MGRTLLAVIAAALAACAQAAPGRGDPAPREPGAELGSAADVADAMRDRGSRVDTGGTISRPFLGPEGQRLVVDGDTLEVYPYATREDARSAAAAISPDGASVGDRSVTWTGPPHWFQGGRILLLYVGSDRSTLQELEELLGHEVAAAAEPPARR